MNVYSILYKHNDTTCCFERDYTLVERNCGKEWKSVIDALPSGIYTFGKSKKDANNYRTICKISSGELFIGN